MGSTSRRADAGPIDELRRYALGESFDERPLPDLDSEAVDFRVASESFAPVRKLARRDLATLRLVTAYPGRTVPTVAGVLLFGRDRARYSCPARCPDPRCSRHGEFVIATGTNVLYVVT